MRKGLLLITTAGLLLVPIVAAGAADEVKVAIHVLPHEERSCGAGIPVITDCADIETTYDGCEAFDVFPVFFGLAEVNRIEYGLTWPVEWGDCVFTPCAGDRIVGDIAAPGDGVIHEWNECHSAWSIVTGFATFDAVSIPGGITPTVNPQTGLLVATSCSGGWVFATGLASAGVCGAQGDDPCACGCPSNPTTWGAIKSLFQ
jgi:hypothetical protein